MSKTFLRTTADTIMKAVVVVFTIVSIVVVISLFYQVEQEISDGSCNVAVYPVEGVILPYYGLSEFDMISTPDGLEDFFEQVEDEEGIEAVLLEINSPGGTPVASARMAEIVDQSAMPVVGLAGDTVASGGYLIASAVDYLVASPLSSIGSIAVNMSYVEESKKNEEEGLTYVQLTTGKFKDLGSTNRAITDEERELLKNDLQLVHDEFVRLVSEYREMDIEKVKLLADGASMPGTRAFDNGLVDALGGREKARESIAQILNKPVEDIKFCEYKRSLLAI